MTPDSKRYHYGSELHGSKGDPWIPERWRTWTEWHLVTWNEVGTIITMSGKDRGAAKRSRPLDTMTIATPPIPSFTQETQNWVCSQLCLSRELYHFLVPIVHLIPGWLSFLQSIFPFTPISSSTCWYILYFTYYCRHFTPIFWWWWGTSGESIKWRRRERVENQRKRREASC